MEIFALSSEFDWGYGILTESVSEFWLGVWGPEINYFYIEIGQEETTTTPQNRKPQMPSYPENEERKFMPGGYPSGNWDSADVTINQISQWLIQFALPLIAILITTLPLYMFLIVLKVEICTAILQLPFLPVIFRNVANNKDKQASRDSLTFSGMSNSKIIHFL